MTEDQVEYKSIDATARNGEPYIIRRGDDLARACWTGDMWAYDVPVIVEQVDFEPTHYGDPRAKEARND